MSMLENAVASIRLGVEDYQAAAQDDARALSALRNLTSGLLLLFKVKLQVLSPTDSNESLLKQTVVPGLGADGNPIWIGRGSKTVDVQSIIDRLKGLGVNDVDWKKLTELTVLRNDVEHYFSPRPVSALLAAMGASFHLIQQFAPKYLGQSPVQLLGPEVWSFLVKQNDFYEAESKACREALQAVDWPTPMLAEFAFGAQCDRCRSELIKPVVPIGQPPATRFQCTSCDAVASYEETVERILVKRHFRDLYLTATQGGEPPLERCSYCGHRTYIVDELVCALCQENSPGLSCVECGGQLDHDHDPDDELYRLCDFCRSVAGMD